MPRKTSIERLTTTICASVSAPIIWPNLSRRTEVILSIMIRLARVRPLESVGSTRTRGRTSARDEVSGQIVTEFVASNLSDCRISAGRGFLV